MDQAIVLFALVSEGQCGMAQMSGKMAAIRVKMARMSAQERPRGPKTGPRRLKRGRREAQLRSKRGPGGPKRGQEEPPREPKRDPRRLQSSRRFPINDCRP